MDALGDGLVTSLARPGGNVTGLSTQFTMRAAKRLELLARGLPSFAGWPFWLNVDYSGGGPEMGEVRTAANTLGLEIVALEIRRAEDIAPAFEALKGRAEALYVCADPLVNTHRFTSTPWRSPPTADHVRHSGIRRCRRSDVLWSRTSRTCAGVLPTMSTRFCAARSRRSSGRAADEIRAGRQPDCGQGARFQASADLLTRADEMIE